MRRQILLGIVKIGNIPLATKSLTEDQFEGLLKDNLISTVPNHKEHVILTEKGKKIYNALEAVVAIGTNW